jgi:hypothetical protein
VPADAGGPLQPFSIAFGPARLHSAFASAMSAEPKIVPETQAALSGGPPKPPKKTSRGLEDGAPDPESEVREIEKRLRETLDRLIDGASNELLVPGLSDVKRGEHEKILKSLQEMRKRHQNEKAEPEGKERGDGR